MAEETEYEIPADAQPPAKNDPFEDKDEDVPQDKEVLS